MKKLLLVEDDEIMLRMYKKLFSFKGFDVTAATNGLDGLKQARTLKPDLIILDVMMPEMNGLELLEVIKKDQAIKHIPIVMLTNLNIEEEIQAALTNGASLFIIKNEHEPQKVFEMVINLIGNKIN